MSLDKFPALAALQDDLTRLSISEMIRSARSPSLEGFPALLALQEDLTRLSVSESCRERPRPATGLSRVRYPGLGEFLVTVQQLAVIRELMSALLYSRSPEVHQSRLLAVAGTGDARLRQVFANSPGWPAWGTLVIRGLAARTYRLADPSAPDEDANGNPNEVGAADTFQS